MFTACRLLDTVLTDIIICAWRYGVCQQLGPKIQSTSKSEMIVEHSKYL